VDPKYGASLQVQSARQDSDTRGLLIHAQVVLTNGGDTPLPLDYGKFAVELPSGLAYDADLNGTCVGNQLVGGHSAGCMLEFLVPPPGLAVAVLYTLPDQRVLRAPTTTQPCQTCGSNQCHDLATDVQNCGACGVHVSYCSGGVASCQPGFSLCAGGCVDTTSDAANCGACGLACSAGKQCRLGQCVTATCASAANHNACIDCCQQQQSAGSATYVRLYKTCLCTSPGDCAVDCQTDFCATGSITDTFCQLCIQQSTCDPLPQCKLDAACSAYLACASPCPSS
jgi:hypothetical protein